MYAKKEKKQRKISASLPEILRETTLEEFLEAVERVKAGDILTELYDDKANIVKSKFFFSFFCIKNSKIGFFLQRKNLKTKRKKKSTQKKMFKLLNAF